MFDLFAMFFLRWHLFVLKFCYHVLCILCEPTENVSKTFCKKINYLELVSESKSTLENSASMIKADAEAAKKLSWR